MVKTPKTVPSGMFKQLMPDTMRRNMRLVRFFRKSAAAMFAPTKVRMMSPEKTYIPLNTPASSGGGGVLPLLSHISGVSKVFIMMKMKNEHRNS